MKYLKITNQGLIVPEDLMLIGSSTKREQTGKIGMFGSGWKYALAWLVRNDCTPVIYAGLMQILIDFRIVLHRDTPVKVITVDDRDTSLTADMGPKWTGWMAVREILSNAIDEGNHTIAIVDEISNDLLDSKTTIFIPMNNELEEVMNNFDSYFAFNRVESYSNNYGRVFVKPASCKINIYRKGIRCYNTEKESLVDFDFNDIEINEDRLCGEHDMDCAARNFIRAGVPAYVLKAVLLSEYRDFVPSDINESIKKNLVILLGGGCTFTTSAIQRTGGLFISDAKALVIPEKWYKELQAANLVPSLFELFSGSSENFINTGDKDTSGISYFLGCFNISLEIRSGVCVTDVFVNNNIVYVKRDTTHSDQVIAARIMQKLPESFYTAQMAQEA